MAFTNEFSIIMWVLCGVYGLLTLVPLTVLVVVHGRAPRVGWTILKLYLVITFIASFVRSISFGLFSYFDITNFFLSTDGDSHVFLILFNMPRIIFYTGFSLLILFWVEILHKVNHQIRYRLTNTKTIYIMLNLLIYLIQAIIWIPLFLFPDWATTIKLPIVENIIFIIVTMVVAGLFLTFGGRLFLKLKSFPIESEGRNKVLWEVGTVTFICFISFLIRAGFLITVTVNEIMDNNPILILVYHLTVEIIPMIAVLTILTRPNGETKPLEEYDNSTFSDKSVQPISGHIEAEISHSSSTFPNTRLYYASLQPRYPGANDNLTPTYSVTIPSGYNPNQVDENYVDIKKPPLDKT